MKDESKDYEAMLHNFNCMIDSKADVINRITPSDYVITPNDEWNDFCYDEYNKAYAMKGGVLYE